MTEDWLERVRRISVWRRADERAPHKPLLLLYAIGRLRSGHETTPWLLARQELGRLLEDFGPPRKPKPENPFTRLQKDGLWVLREASGRRYEGPPDLVRPLAEKGVTGELDARFQRALSRSEDLAARVAGVVLNSHFPETLHSDLCAAVRLDLVPAFPASEQPAERRRDPRFRPLVVTAFEGRCAVCRYAGRLAGKPVGVEAAHVRWFSASGPDELTNGLCMCSLHHRLFDGGAFGLTDELTVTVAGSFTDGSVPDGAELWLPPSVRPALEHVRWHRREVLKR